MTSFKLQNINYIVLLFLLSYIYIGTGIYSDDYIMIKNTLNSNLEGFFFPDPYKVHVSILNPLAYLHHQVQFFIFEYNYFFYDTFKIITSFFSIYLIAKFFEIFTSKNNSFFISVLFVLLPIHDAANYMVAAGFYIIIFAVLMTGFRLIYYNNYKIGFTIALLGNFISYNSPPISFGLSVIFLFEKEYKKFILFLTPQILYIVYYLVATELFEFNKGRLNEELSFVKLVKYYVLQVGSFIDASIGPSFWFKVYYSVIELTAVSSIIGVILIVLFYRFYEIKKNKINNYLLISLILIMLFSFGIFSLTGLYPQIAFNLGNRVTIFGALLISFLIVTIFIKGKKSATLIFAVFIFSVLGLSDHWKSWNQNQLQVIENISENQDIRELNREKQIFVTHNQYSKLGDISHIEFFTAGIEEYIFELATGYHYKVSTLNRRFVYEDMYIIDKKYNTKIKVDESINVYDSKANKVIKVKEEDIQNYIDSLPKDNRHWMQFIDKNNVIMKIVLNLMPRLEYAL